MRLMAYVSPSAVKKMDYMGSMHFSQILESRPREYRYVVAKVDKKYWLIDLYASKVTANKEIVMGEYKVFPNYDAALAAAKLLL